MAYVSVEKTKQVRDDLKAKFPGWKFSVSKESGNTSFIVSVLSGPLEILPQNQGLVNHYYLFEATASFPQSEKWLNFLTEVKNIMTVGHWDDSDSQSDYFNTAFYYSLSIGKWDKPYVGGLVPKMIKAIKAL